MDCPRKWNSEASIFVSRSFAKVGGNLNLYTSVCHKYFNLAYIFWSKDRALIFGMHDPWDKPFQLAPCLDILPTSRSNLLPQGGNSLKYWLFLQFDCGKKNCHDWDWNFIFVHAYSIGLFKWKQGRWHWLWQLVFKIAAPCSKTDKVRKGPAGEPVTMTLTFVFVHKDNILEHHKRCIIRPSWTF